MRPICILNLLIIFNSCATVPNLRKPSVTPCKGSYFLEVSDKSQLFVYDFQPIKSYHATIYLISGITGINHIKEKDIIEQLGNNENRVVVLHPRGTGYSDGVRGDITDFSDFINDYIEIISRDDDYRSKQHKILLFGLSMSTAIVLSVADKLKNVGGVILVNPPYKVKKANGMSPGVGQYMKYAWYYLLDKHKPVVNMAGDPARIINEEDRKESEARSADPLLVSYFSMYMMIESRKLLNSMIYFCGRAKYPLLLIYGLNDNLVDEKGCDMLFKKWKSNQKQYSLVKNGSHGKSTVILAKGIINSWIKELLVASG
jgi:alpha-beta hydrolase superfamily lysophospholipase